MPVLYSRKAIGYDAAIDGSSASTLYAGITAVLAAAGWAATGTVSGGVEYTILSPQLLPSLTYLSCLVRVYVYTASDSVNTNYGVTTRVRVQFATLSGTGGFIHDLVPRSGSTWICWANCCSLAIARSGYSRKHPVTTDIGTHANVGGFAFIGAIPWVQDDFTCDTAAAAPVVTDLWFTSGDYDGSIFYRDSLRNSTRSDITICSASTNGSVLTAATATDLTAAQYSGPQLLIFPPAQTAYGVYYSRSARSRWWNAVGTVAKPIWYVPYLAWGTVGNVYAILRGIMFDALLSSVAQDIDASINLTDDDEGTTRDWWNYTYDPESAMDGESKISLTRGLDNGLGSFRNYHGSLLLLQGGPSDTGLSNCAY